MILRAALPLLLLAACSKGTDSNADGKLSAAEVSAESAKLKLKPGQWETTTLITDMSVPGLPAESMKAATGTRTTTRNCVTPAQAAKPDASLFTGRKDANCTYQRFSMADAKIDAAMTCQPAGLPGAMAMTLSGNHSATHFAMGMTMTTDTPGPGAMTVKATVSGKHLGACTANPETMQ